MNTHPTPIFIGSFRKNLLLLIMAFAIQFTSFAQIPNWYFFKPSSNGSVIRFNPSPSLYSSSIPVFMDHTGINPISNYYAVNTLFDDNGEALFYIVLTELNGGTSGYFYDKNGNILLEKDFFDPYLFTNTVPSREIPIINLGCGKHHAIVGNFIIEIDIKNNTWSNLFSSSNPLGNLNVFGMSGSPDNITTALEIGSLNASTYKIYNLIGNYPGAGNRSIRVVEINYLSNVVANTTDYNITTVTLPGSSTPISTNFTGSISELEVSPNNDYLAFAEDEYLLVFNLDGSGNINSSSPIYKYYFYQNTPSTKDYSIAGLEFTRNSNSLVFSRFDPQTTFTEEIAVWDFVSSSTPNFISGTANFVRSQIELGIDDKIYTSSSTHLAEVTTSGTLAVTDIIATSINFNHDPNNYQIRILPDQVSGHTYAVPAYEINTYDVTSSGTWSPGAGNNPFNVTSDLSVITKITVKNGVTLTIEDLNLNFFTNAEVVVEAGASLTLKNATLKSHSCGLMWKGINVLDNGSIGGNVMITNNSTFQTSLIQDAIKGIKINGPNSWLIVHGYTDFTGNETDIEITNGNANFIQIYRANFIGNLPLKDQSKGSNIGWTLDNLNRTITHIHIENCIGKINIGTSGFGGCDFKYANFGVKAINSSATIINNLFTEQKVYGVHGDASKIQQKDINLYSNTFTDVQQPVRLENWINSEIQSNHLYGSKEWGIHYLENENCNLVIGHLTDPSKGNILDFCNWVGIDLSENSGPQTNINIGHNIINNHPYATGIVVSEYGSGASPSYELFRINNNSMTGIGAGIKLYNVEGWNSDYSGLGPRPHEFLFNGANLIDSNDINFTTALDAYKIGIQTTNSSKLNIHVNTVVSDASYDWRNTGILTDDAYWTSIYNNTSTAGSGIRIGGNMLYSNVYCNSLPNSFTGIFLNYCYLRGVGDFHGIIPTQARENSFPSTTGGFDMRMYYSDNDLNQWIFYSTIPTIDYTFASGVLPTIEGGYGNDVCNGDTPPPPPPSDYGDEGKMYPSNNTQNRNSGSPSNQKILIPSQSGLKNHIATTYNQINTYKASIRNAKDSLSFNLAKSDFVNKVARIEYFIQNKKIDSATTIVNSISTNNPLEKELLDVYTLLFQSKQNKQKLSAREEEQLLHIARKNQFTQSIASPLARTIAKQVLHLDIYDSIELIPEINGTISSNCTISSRAGLMVQLVNMDNSPTGIFTSTDSSGRFKISGIQLSKLSSVLNYKLICIFPDSSKAQSYANTLGNFMQPKGVELYCQTNLLKTKKSEDRASEIIQTKIYPNPSNGLFTIENGQENSEAIVYDLLGKIVFTQKLSNKTNIDLSTQPKGVYFIKIIGAKTESFKLILE